MGMGSTTRVSLAVISLCFYSVFGGEPGSSYHHRQRHSSPYDTKPEPYSYSQSAHRSDYHYHQREDYYPHPRPTYLPKQTTYLQIQSYEAISFRNFNASLQCGVLPATNDDLYQRSKDVAPFGKAPWVVQITDEYNNFVCQGVVVQNGFIMTARSCLSGPVDKYRVRVDDWDLQTNYNEYEAYKNGEFRICETFPVTYNGYSSQSYSDAKLIILRIDQPEDAYDKYPAYRHICIPTFYQKQKQSYSPKPDYDGYNNNAPPPPGQKNAASPYSEGHHYQAVSHLVTSYQRPKYKAPSPPAPAECWVVGWYKPGSNYLQNHPPPIQLQEVYGGGNDGYGTQSSSYKKEGSYYQKYYQHQDQSKVQKGAKVKEIQCPSSSLGYGSKSSSSSYGYGYQDEDVCFVGVEGYDACVADKGAAVFCLVAEKGYQSYGESYGYNRKTSSYGYQNVFYANYAAYDNSYRKELSAHQSPAKQTRRRAVLYAIVQQPTTCTDQQHGYNSAYQQQSKPIVGTKMTYQVVQALKDAFWERGEDDSCPAPRSHYPEPSVQVSYHRPPQKYQEESQPAPYHEYEQIRRPYEETRPRHQQRYQEESRPAPRRTYEEAPPRPPPNYQEEPRPHHRPERPYPSDQGYLQIENEEPAYASRSYDSKPPNKKKEMEPPRQHEQRHEKESSPYQTVHKPPCHTSKPKYELQEVPSPHPSEKPEGHQREEHLGEERGHYNPHHRGSYHHGPYRFPYGRFYGRGSRFPHRRSRYGRRKCSGEKAPTLGWYIRRGRLHIVPGGSYDCD